MTSDRANEDWLPSYYQRLVSEYQFSLGRRDSITNWALTLFLAIIAAYVAIVTSQTHVSSSWRIGLLLVALGLSTRFFFQSTIAYSFLRRWRYLENQIESHWATGKPSLQGLLIDFEVYDHGRRTTVTKFAMLWSQLRAGFLLIFLALSGVLSVEISHLPHLTPLLIVMFLGFSLYVVWEIVIFVSYDQLKKPEEVDGARNRRTKRVRY